jgi:hypothetical protein
MITFKTFITERMITIHPDKFDKHDDYVAAKHDFVKSHWDELQKSYEPMGGYAGAASAEELADSIHTIKGVKRNGKVVAWSGYKKQFGRKAVVSSTDGSVEGKKGYREIAREDDLDRGQHKRNAWAEKSGPAAKVAEKMGANKVPNSEAERLTGKEIISKDDDGHHYTRLIGGHIHKKAMYGKPKDTDD